jgi:hypothetical protein
MKNYLVKNKFFISIFQKKVKYLTLIIIILKFFLFNDFYYPLGNNFKILL